MNASELTRNGYRVISRKFGTVARIDRPDWKKVLNKSKDWFEAIGEGSAEDFYRRVHSQDKRQVSLDVLREIPGSGHEVTGYVELP